MWRVFLAGSPDGACSCPPAPPHLPASCFPGGSGVSCEQEVMLVYLSVNDIKIPAALDLGGA
jgi:hypothetical protein